MAHIDYPVDFPLDCASTLINTVRQGTVRENAAEFAHCLWNVQGYLQGHFIGRPAAMFGAGTVIPSPKTLERIDEIESSLTTFVEDMRTVVPSTEDTASEEPKKGGKKKKEVETFGAAADPNAVDPMTIALIVQAAMQILKLIEQWRNRK